MQSRIRQDTDCGAEAPTLPGIQNLVLLLALLLLPGNGCNRDSLGLHQGFQQGNGFGERIRSAFEATGAASRVEGSAAVGIFGTEVGAVSNKEFDVLIETVFGSAVQRGLIGNGIGTGHLTVAAPSLGRGGSGALTRYVAPADPAVHH